MISRTCVNGDSAVPLFSPLLLAGYFYSLLVVYFAPVWFFCSSRDNNTELCFGGMSPFPQRNVVGPVRFGFAFVAEDLLFSGSIEYSPFRWARQEKGPKSLVDSHLGS